MESFPEVALGVSIPMMEISERLRFVHRRCKYDSMAELPVNPEAVFGYAVIVIQARQSGAACIGCHRQRHEGNE